MINIVFMGTPAFAVPSLQALHAHHRVVGVVTQPDRPSGRGRQPLSSPVKQYAVQAGLPVIQPVKLREPAALEQLQAWQPELIVVAAFGQILKPAVLELPRLGCINVHASLLPRWRGAAPIPAAIAAGDPATGVTIMRMDAGLDTGPMLAAETLPIAPTDTTESLTPRLADLGARLLLTTLPDYAAGRCQPQLQNEAETSYAPQLKKEDGHLDFQRPAAELERLVRALAPWPGAFALWEGQPFKILQAQLSAAGGEPGQVLSTPTGPAIACGAGALQLEVIQPPGKKAMAAADFVRGTRQFIGARLT